MRVLQGSSFMKQATHQRTSAAEALYGSMHGIESIFLIAKLSDFGFADDGVHGFRKRSSSFC